VNVSRTVLVAVCAVVIGVYVYIARLGVWETMPRNPADDYYNLLVQGFRAGQLSMNEEVPPGLARLSDPYNPAANAPYRASANRAAPHRLHDLSYYKGRLFLYWGVTPALMLFWPFVVMTGRYLPERQAVTIFCAVGFLASAWLLRAVWRRYLAEVSVWVVAACILALGLAAGVPMLLGECEVYEVAISCGYMLIMLALGAIWCALHEMESRKRSGWLMAASAAYGLAVAARPSLLFGSAILLVPVIEAWRERRNIWTPLLAAIVPITLIGLGLMIYNERRFDNPFEFGWHYQLAPSSQMTSTPFSLRYFWFNLRVYFLEPVRWSRHFPFTQDIVAPPLPAGHYPVEDAFGILTNTPFVWLALAVPLAWRSRSGQATSTLRWFVTAVALLVGICAVTMATFFAASMRYEVDFLPALVLLAAIGIMGLERALGPNSESRLADRPGWRRVARWSWGVLGAFSVIFNLLATVQLYANERWEFGTALAQAGRVREAIPVFEEVVRLKLNNAVANVNLGNAYLQTDRAPDAAAQFERALSIKPNYPEAHYNLGIALEKSGRVPEAIEQYEQALRINPNYAEAHEILGIALAKTGEFENAIAQYEQALRIRPDYAEAHYNCGVALVRLGKAPEAISHWEQALQIEPDYAEAHFNLALALEKSGRTPEAIEHYQQALKLRPDFMPARNALTRLGASQ
jgi:tetratricopeptide (TPR) repeat protein